MNDRLYKKLLSGAFLLLFWGLSAPSSHASAAPETFEKILKEQILKIEEFQFIHHWCARNGLRAWLLGGAASSYAFAVKEQFFEKSMPSTLAFSEVFNPFQDVDVVIDGNVEQALALKEAIKKRFPYFVKRKSLWDVLTLHPYNGRGILQNPNFSEQHSDLLSLGLIEIGDNFLDGLAVRNARNFQSSSSAQQYLNAIWNNQNPFLFSESHENTFMFKEKKNPPIMAILRYLVKADRHNISIDQASLSELKRCAQGFKQGSFDGKAYTYGKIQQYLFQLIVGARDIEQVLRWFDQLGLRKALLDFPMYKRNDTPGQQSPSFIQAGTARSLYSLLQKSSVEGIFPSASQANSHEFLLEEIAEIRSGDLIEGHTLKGAGPRPYFLVLKEHPKFSYYLNQARPFSNSHHSIEQQVLSLAKLVREAISREHFPGINLLPEIFFRDIDSLDYALTTCVLFNEAGFQCKIKESRQGYFINHVSKNSLSYEVDAKNNSSLQTSFSYESWRTQAIKEKSASVSQSQYRVWVSRNIPSNQNRRGYCEKNFQ